jgi:hypothetical protein
VQVNPLAQNFGSQTRTPLLLLAMVAGAYWLVGASLAQIDWPVLLLTVALVVAGCFALVAIRPQKAGLSPPHVMLSLGFGGMLIGLAWDVTQTGVMALEDLCAGTEGLPFAAALKAHLMFLPGMHVGMIVGGLAAIPGLRLLRPDCGRYLCSVFAQNLMCSGWMLLGMTAGALWLSRLATVDGYGLTEMLGGMFAGMTWGMVLSVALYRGYFRLKDRRARVASG